MRDAALFDDFDVYSLNCLISAGIVIAKPYDPSELFNLWKRCDVEGEGLPQVTARVPKAMNPKASAINFISHASIGESP